MKSNDDLCSLLDIAIDVTKTISTAHYARSTPSVEGGMLCRYWKSDVTNIVYLPTLFLIRSDLEGLDGLEGLSSSYR